MKRTSYWLVDSSKATNNESIPQPPPSRPCSPNSGEPLRLKDLIPLDLKKDGDNNVLCCVTGKTISTQPVIAIKKTRQVMLQSVYDDLVKEHQEYKKSSSMLCPITGRKFKEKDVVVLVKGSSGFAASGKIEVKKYIPTLT